MGLDQQKETQEQEKGRGNRDSPALAMVTSAPSPIQHPHLFLPTAATVHGFHTVSSPELPSETKGMVRRFIRRERKWMNRKEVRDIEHLLEIPREKWCQLGYQHW